MLQFFQSIVYSTKHISFIGTPGSRAQWAYVATNRPFAVRPVWHASIVSNTLGSWRSSRESYDPILTKLSGNLYINELSDEIAYAFSSKLVCLWDCI